MSSLLERNGSPTLKDVLPAALQALGLGGPSSALIIRESRHVVVLLVDGLGELQLQKFIEHAPIFELASGGSIQTEFPSTTPVALGSLGTGLHPGGHGLVGASFWLPEEMQLLAPLKWGSDPHPLSVIPESTLFEYARDQGVSVSTVAPAKHKFSGLTRSVLRGSDYFGADNTAEIVETFRERQAHLRTIQNKGLTYIYWPDLDRLGHIYGVGSDQWLEGLRMVNSLVSLLREELTSSDTLLVTSDHGMVVCPPENRIAIEQHQMLMEGVRLIGGEPRVRHVYVQPGAQSDVVSAWRSVLGTRAMVLTRQESMDGNLFEIDDDAFADRVGDVVVVAADNFTLSSTNDPLSSALLGQHGSLTPDEMIIPLKIFTRGDSIE